MTEPGIEPESDSRGAAAQITTRRFILDVSAVADADVEKLAEDLLDYLCTDEYDRLPAAIFSIDGVEPTTG